MPYLQSVVIEAVAYDEKTRLLTARFRGSGKVVTYEEVPPEIYDSLIFADSISAFFRNYIENIYPLREASRPGGKRDTSLSASFSRF
ncbi:MAG TPA: KTSC domain-containing protein [Rhizomicrobium sp.]|jgi:hypothetical protein|nr:KTSC domain-containing protein [Rhizomicrobium sp.]